jgi:hypothetical protein
MGTKARDFSRSLGLGGGGNVNIADILPLLTTANVVEIASANLYFTNSRVFANLELASINILADVDTVTRPAANGDVLVWDGYNWSPNTITGLGLNFTTDDVPEGTVNLYYTNARVRSAVGAANPTIIYDENTGLFAANLEAVAASANTTDSIPEGFNNFYYTNARVFANIQLASIDDLYDVEYEFYSNTAEPRDQFSNGPFEGASLVWRQDGQDYLGNPKGAWIPKLINANTVASLFGLTTDNLAEGANNLYFTNARAEVAVANTSINVHFDVNTSNNLEVGRVLGWTGTAWEPFALSNISDVGSSLVSNFAELANIANVSLFTVSAGFAELSNVANTALRASFANFAELANSVVNASVANTVATLFGLTTDDLAEGANNLYYSNLRVLSRLAETSIDILSDVATSNATYGDILFWDGTKWVPNNVSQTAVSAGFAERSNVANTVLSLAGFTSDDITEGIVNYYYTLDRLNADIQTALVGKDILLDDLIVAGDLTVRGNSAILNVSNLFTESRLLVLSSGAQVPAQAEGSGIVIAGANAQLTFAEQSDSFGFNKNLVVNGNILPAVGRTYNLGSFDRPWRGLFLNASTLYLGNLAISQGPDGGMQITDISTGELAGVGLANVTATQTVTVDRIQGNSSPEVELNGYLGGNVLQYTEGKTGNVYFGILKDNDLNKFAGMRVIERKYNGSNVQSDIVFYTDREGLEAQGRTNSFPRLAIEGSGNIVVQGNVTVNGNTLVQIARTSISTETSIVANYANTNQASSYNQETGIITVNKDGVYEATAILTLNEDWQDTPIKAAYIPTGTYVVQIRANDSAVGGGHTQEYYSGVMSWYSDDTDSGTADEIAMHRAGAGPGNGTIFLRVQRTLTANSDDLKLQIAGTTTNNDVSSYTFKFRRLL